MEQRDGGSRPASARKAPEANARAMLEARAVRKRAEADAQLLANRLAHLKAEEDKARRKIDETKARAREIAGLKKRNEEEARAKAATHQARQQGMSLEQRRVLGLKETDRQHREASRRLVEVDRKTNASSARQEKQVLQTEYQQKRAQEVEENRRRTLAIRARQEELRRRREQEEEERRRRVQEEYARRLAEEARRTAAAEKTIRDMEAAEDAAIARLKAAQDEQRRAYQELQATLEP